ncbi:MAG TPA: hypothetical protein VJ692_10770 [Nitrospiraceae bacterium]|nr:hypothetical protein [Nitrospiraceae bacterium]
MPTLRVLLGVMAMVILFVGGCAGHHDVQQTQAQQIGGAWPLDSLAYIYSDPVAASPVDDNPFRWLGFILNPVGVALDYVVNRPLYTLASSYPSLFGFTPEDATLHAQRPNRDYGNY